MFLYISTMNAINLMSAMQGQMKCGSLVTEKNKRFKIQALYCQYNNIHIIQCIEPQAHL